MNFINKLDPKAFITVYNVSNMRYQPKCKKKKFRSTSITEVLRNFFTVISCEKRFFELPHGAKKTPARLKEKKSERMQMDTINDIVIVQIRTLF